MPQQAALRDFLANTFNDPGFNDRWVMEPSDAGRGWTNADLGSVRPYFAPGTDLNAWIQQNGGDIQAILNRGFGGDTAVYNPATGMVTYKSDADNNGSGLDAFMNSEMAPVALFTALYGGVGGLGNLLGAASGAGAGTGLAEEIATLTGSGVGAPGAGLTGAAGATGAGAMDFLDPWDLLPDSTITYQAPNAIDLGQFGLEGTEVFRDPWDLLPDPTIQYQTPNPIDLGPFGSNGFDARDLLNKLKEIPGLNRLLNQSAADVAKVVKGLFTPGGNDGNSGFDWSNIFGGNGTSPDWLKLLGQLGATGLGAYGASKQTDLLKDLADRYYEMGAPSRGRYESSFSPDFSMANEPGYAGALQSTSDAVMRSLSAKGGNPWGNPAALAEGQKYLMDSTALPALYNYRSSNANTGGYNAFNQAVPGLAQGAANANGNIYNALGYGLNSLTNPQPNMLDVVKALTPKASSSALASVD